MQRNARQGSPGRRPRPGAGPTGPAFTTPTAGHAGRHLACAVGLGAALWLAGCGGGEGPPAVREDVTARPSRSVLAAFPGAQGGGAESRGGRGGRVFIVNRLADDGGSGTLRECVEWEGGARTCVFAVGGTIALQAPLYVTAPYLTVAGQTAPGGGIQITNAPGVVISNLVSFATHDVLWQYTRLRHSYRAECADAAHSECGALFTAFSGSYNLVADHNSLSWNKDEAFGVWRSAAGELRNLTFSKNLIAEGLESHSTGLIAGADTAAWASGMTDIDFHHNLVMNNSHRNPLLKLASGRVVNNLYYNQDFYVVQVGGGARVDVVGNDFRQGPMNGAAAEVQAYAANTAQLVAGNPSLYLSGNRGWNQTQANGDQWLMARQVSTENGGELGTVPSTWRRGKPLAGTRVPLVAQPVAQIVGASGSIVPTVGASRRLDCAGNWVPNRDAVDTRLIEQYLTGTGIASLLQTGPALPLLPAGTPCPDSDGDGLPDAWELLKFGTLAQGPNGDIDGDGYTHLEAYLQGL